MALHVASNLGATAIVRKLIQRGHNVNAHNGSGWTPLQNAAFYGNTEVARELIRAGADVDLKVKGPGKNVLGIAAYYIFLIMMKISVLCSRLIMDAGVGIGEQEGFLEGRTALMLAAQNGHSAVVAELVKAGADVYVKDSKEMTAVLLARNFDVIRQLKVQNVEHLSKEYRSQLLWHACDQGDSSMVQSLIKAGCDVDHVHKGQTPVMMATVRGHDRIVKELILANCDVNQHSKGYYSDLRSSLSLGRQLLPSAMMCIAIMVPWFALTLSSGRPVVIPSWVNPWTGSVAVLAAPVCVTAAASLPASWPAVLIWVAIVSGPVTMMVWQAAAAGPVVWAVGAVMAIAGLLWAWGLRATLTAIVKCSVFFAKSFALVLCLLLLLFISVFAGVKKDIVPTWVENNFWVIIFVLLFGKCTFDTVTKKQTIAVVTGIFSCLICLTGPTWPWMEHTAVFFSLYVFLFITWLVTCKAPDATALHYAAGHNSVKCGGLLVEAGADLSARNKCLWSPSDIGSNRLNDEMKRMLSFAAKRTIAVIGHAECGKSTVIAALVTESKNWWMKVINHFRKVHDIRQRTAGIDPIKFSSQKYGEALFYDFAGQSQYHGPHQSFLEAMMNKLGVSVTLLILVKATEKKDTITQQLYRWLQPLALTSAPSTPLAIVVGSFYDCVNGTDKKKEASAKLLECTEIVQKDLPLQLQGPFLLDCRQPESGGMNQIRDLLQKVQAMQLSTKSLPYNLHWVLVQVRKAFSTPAVRLHEFQTWLQVTSIDLPRNLPSPEELCQDLSATGHTLFLPNKQDPSHSWLILDLPSILHDVYGTLFSGAKGKVNQFGLLHCSQLNELFPELDQELIQNVLISLEFCIQINPLVLKKELLQLTIDEREEGWLYFPALVSAQPSKVFPEDADPDQFRWMCWQLRTAEKHFISAHLLQTIILRLAANHVFAHNSVRQHCCSVWINGLSWSSTKGVDVAVQISDSCMVQVVGGSKVGAEKLQKYTAAVVQDVVKTINQLSPKLEATPYIVHPYTHTLWEDPKAPQPHSLYPVLDVIDCISCGDDHTLSLSPNTSSVPIGRLFGGEFPSLSTVQCLDYPGVSQDGSPEPSPSPLLSAPTLNELNQLVVWRVAAEWYPLGLSLGVEPAVLNIVQANHPGDVEEACRDLLCRWLSRGPGTGEQPRVWLSILKAIKETVGERIAEEVEREAVSSI